MLRNTLQALALGASKLPRQAGVFSAAAPTRFFSNQTGVAAAAAQDAATLPVADTVDYDEKYASQITITGHLGRDLQIRKNKFGVVGSATMAIHSGRGKPTTWVDLLISDEQRAREAEPLMRKGAFVQVVGLLDISQKVDDDGNELPHITVHVQNVDVRARQQQETAEGADAAAPPQQRKRQQYLSLPPDVTAPEADADVTQLSKEQQWAHVAAHPSRWWDQRAKKTNPKQPDFKIRDKTQGDVALWMDSKGVPAWVAAQAGGGQQQQQLQQEAPAAASPAPAAAAAAAPKTRGRSAAASPAAFAAAPAPAPAAAAPAPPSEDADVTQLSKEELWAHVAAYPQRWWDNRTNKRSEKGPDFSLKSKDVKLALWITSKDTPAWAREKFTIAQ